MCFSYKMWSVGTKVILKELKTLKKINKNTCGHHHEKKKWSKLWRAEPICLWGCSNITNEDIKLYIQMQVRGIIHNKKSNKLFKSYIQSNQTTDESITLKYLEFYEFCESILSDSDSLQYYVPQLLEICPEEIWKQKIDVARAVDANVGNNLQLKEVLDELKDECLLNIEHERDFNKYLDKLRSKLKK